VLGENMMFSLDSFGEPKEKKEKVDGFYSAGAEEKTPLPFHDGAGKPVDGGIYPEKLQPESGCGRQPRNLSYTQGQKKDEGGLSTGDQQFLALGRALMQKPRLLLAEEPARGFSWGG
jgi:ABC-type sugar transport system ATPase subunit